MQLLQKTLGKARVTFSLLLVFILPIKWGRVFGVGLDVFLSLFWSLPKPVLPLPPNSLRQFKNCVTADSEIGNENYVAAESEINSENCVTADFWQRKTASPPNSEISSENCFAADSEISSATASLPIQKSAAMVESSIPHIYSFGCLHLC